MVIKHKKKKWSVQLVIRDVSKKGIVCQRKSPITPNYWNRQRSMETLTHSHCQVKASIHIHNDSDFYSRVYSIENVLHVNTHMKTYIRMIIELYIITKHCKNLNVWREKNMNINFTSCCHKWPQKAIQVMLRNALSSEPKQVAEDEG
jgi:hypothetical protein